jgi:5-deoxy-glucuronate isomerase
MPSSRFISRGPRKAFKRGWTRVITEQGTRRSPKGGTLEFGIISVGAGGRHVSTDRRESAWVLLSGSATAGFSGRKCDMARSSLFDEGPTTLHVCGNEKIEITAGTTGVEFAVSYTENSRSFDPRLFLPTEVGSESRGAGLVQGACLRNVRSIFDRASRPLSNLVLGEVVNYPGRWSSYPPHHHAQPEIYHYRFTEKTGYGHAEVGDLVYKVRERDTIAIPPGADHAQVSAPGYGMYYLWVIRHLPRCPYTGFTFAKEHSWALDPSRQGWQPPQTSRLKI